MQGELLLCSSFSLFIDNRWNRKNHPEICFIFMWLKLRTMIRSSEVLWLDEEPGLDCSLLLRAAAQGHHNQGQDAAFHLHTNEITIIQILD